MKLSELNKQYELICKCYIIKFCKKQDMVFEGWIGNEVGDIAVCNDFYFNLHDIILDLKTNQTKGVIIDWYYDNLENPEKHINYYSYTKGLRV